MVSGCLDMVVVGKVLVISATVPRGMEVEVSMVVEVVANGVVTVGIVVDKVNSGVLVGDVNTNV